jgi:hypothetical protein
VLVPVPVLLLPAPPDQPSTLLWYQGKQHTAAPGAITGCAQLALLALLGAPATSMPQARANLAPAPLLAPPTSGPTVRARSVPLLATTLHAPPCSTSG